MPIARINLLVLLALLVVLLLSSCASQHANNQQRYTLPNLDRIKDSARQAFTSKHTWIPLLGAALFSIDDFDEQTLEWASEHNPIFGDIENAKDCSDALAAATEVNWLVTALISPDDSISRGGRLILQGLALSANQSVTSWMKSGINRTRPDRPDKQNSFPSLHASSALQA